MEVSLMYSWKKKVGDIEVFILKDGETEFGVETFSGTNQSEISELLKVNNRKPLRQILMLF
jgi:hypothetical protein